jgi:cell pole-organizing protein PopZ
MKGAEFAEKSSVIYDSTVRQVNDSVKKLVDAKNVISGISNFSQSPAFSELAINLMEPKLEKWLNQNLPDLVEKIVREEIKKMIPKD